MVSVIKMSFETAVQCCSSLKCLVEVSQHLRFINTFPASNFDAPRLHPLGLLRLEELVRRFLISRETLSVRMLDESLDPTPLLKEIRDDKVATIIIDANASISYLILQKVRTLTKLQLQRQLTTVWSSVAQVVEQGIVGLILRAARM